MSPNGLFGSMAIGGMALAMRLKEQWPNVVLNETHPKVLFAAISGRLYREEKLQTLIKWLTDHATLIPFEAKNDHELDAAMSAWATFKGLCHGWRDLVIEQSELLFPAGRVKYLWPPELAKALAP